MNRFVIRAYWQTTALLLVAHFGGWPAGLDWAIALTVVQALHFSAVRRTWRALDVQGRGFSLGLLLLGTTPPFFWVHAAQRSANPSNHAPKDQPWHATTASSAR